MLPIIDPSAFIFQIFWQWYNIKKANFHNCFLLWKLFFSLSPLFNTLYHFKVSKDSKSDVVGELQRQLLYKAFYTRYVPLYFRRIENVLKCCKFPKYDRDCRAKSPLVQTVSGFFHHQYERNQSVSYIVSIEISTKESNPMRLLLLAKHLQAYPATPKLVCQGCFWVDWGGEPD